MTKNALTEIKLFYYFLKTTPIKENATANPFYLKINMEIYRTEIGYFIGKGSQHGTYLKINEIKR
ncbi:hypothetical protein [Chryseobacterium carnipullorum]|uniref:hypothetical protein n=1 Tax=Chryseobacterium carnipullorum TaxID=1124835 RepID=UPI000E7DE2E1|nr:hypothetical protein [Chryseobacterium carnipullorum]HBV13934.1 hypothetical protein [Chryseobacterium carnipullorum]